MINAHTRVPPPKNEPVLSYAPGTTERREVQAELKRMAGEQIDIPVIIGGKHIRTGKTDTVRMPHNHQHVLATLHEADASHAEQAIQAALAVKDDWARMPFQSRAAIFLRAAELLASRYRPILNAATMLGQGKTAHQAEIDAACEAIDFIRFNVHFAEQILGWQPEAAYQTWNMTDYRPLDGFVFAVAPFNFTAIALNLATAPAIMGNVVLFKPSSTAALSAWYIMELLREAGLPDGVINMLPGDGPTVGNPVLASPHLGGIHFTGSTPTFNAMWRTVGENISRYKQYPRIVGETGGKDFIVAHPSAADDLEALAVAIVRGGFEYQGQKCSAASRVFIPESLWPKLKPRLQALISEIRMGDVSDFRNFMGAVIDEKSFKKVSSYIDLAKSDSGASIVAGGDVDRKQGWFVKPTLVQLDSPTHRILREEIFAPLVGLHVYPDAKYEETLREVDQAASYALTGAVFARDRKAIDTALRELRHAAGNFYINDKPTGAVVGQQPFGGGRASGTNDKAGSALNLVRWTSPRTIKETFVPPVKVPYPFMDNDPNEGAI
ncbi:1-pyrroline-5-carboxylate dehydrogenase [Myxococcus xanthus DK 1622]|uniref:L-glutamate gamma-semialdehyde dehydrogenase n=1 Tax=Myxococcus xanthus (strain DK1622) TaxID=246197 RepID=Q1CZZ5_MYXXD|nr:MULTISPECIES: L-glutamate gamma-semialdehyde dehydrogenase [Myxococcus]ABF89021.1 1-pyrroline-5-carboxylate dehydrogenase [Myxococcus xanthus DK 1622]NOJ58198.1 L-glutamate gamma-semialdehyde dehydrogenase [Myxococcus xanthus]QPM78301.1 L-glutamate gamma-semialdehyde dehydrogenase [Myxococcus xanthus]QVW67368.1 L-glutamate gamma-semialdehyde dehydrogenase [Myxococcus xanthus DZ2]QZZ53530.1 1-pyrroline-5-carboxylate dehydrogenase 2 [Myxococcus xanthus]